MKIIFTGKETIAIAGAVRSIGVGIYDSCNLLGQKIDDFASLIAFEGVTDEVIKRFNDDTKGLVVMTKDENNNIILEYNEEYVIATAELTSDFITDFFDVIKYGIKTFIAFGAIKLNKYKEKIESLLEGSDK